MKGPFCQWERKNTPFTDPMKGSNVRQHGQKGPFMREGVGRYGRGMTDPALGRAFEHAVAWLDSLPGRRIPARTRAGCPEDELFAYFNIAFTTRVNTGLTGVRRRCETQSHPLF